jgi:hypothetical protein
MTVQRNHIVLAAAACGAAALATPASAQTKWNEIPPPTGKEALATQLSGWLPHRHDAIRATTAA